MEKSTPFTHKPVFETWGGGQETRKQHHEEEESCGVASCGTTCGFLCFETRTTKNLKLGGKYTKSNIFWIEKSVLHLITSLQGHIEEGWMDADTRNVFFFFTQALWQTLCQMSLKISGLLIGSFSTHTGPKVSFYISLNQHPIISIV